MPPRPSPLPYALCAVVILILFWAAMLASLRNTSQTFDEGVHAAGGYTYWRYNDYRFNPENGNLPQRVIALPLLASHYNFPSTDAAFWRSSQEWGLAWRWFYELGNDADAMNFRGRAAGGLLAVALGFLVWRWSRQLFGEAGGMFSLILYVLSPSILANGALMTSDTAAALFFLAASWSFWRALQKLTFARVVVSGLVMGGLFVSKMSAPLIIPIAFVLIAAKLLNKGPLLWGGRAVTELRSLCGKIVASAVVAIAHAVIVVMVIWGFYGFRYSAFSSNLPSGTWTGETWNEVLEKPSPQTLLDRLTITPQQREQIKTIFKRDHADPMTWADSSLGAIEDLKREVLTSEQVDTLDQLQNRPPPRLVARVLEVFRRHHLLPEAYIYGCAHVWHGSLERAAFLNGNFSLSGWIGFFPYTFLVKTPLTLFFLIVIAIMAILVPGTSAKNHPRRRLSALFYQTSPLLALFVIYWIAAISSHLNIGHRHILPTYPPLFVLCGAMGWWFEKSATTGRIRTLARMVRPATIVAVVLLAAEVGYRFPHYLAYFNGIVSPASAYRHLVYSSLDWGQDLPEVRSYIEKHALAQPIYLSYFGFASPVYYGVPAIYGYSVPDRYRPSPLQTFEVPQGEADAVLYNFLRSHSEYDDKVVGRFRQDDKQFLLVVKRADSLRLHAGTYIISASLLEPITRPQQGAFGPWNTRLEKQYQNAVQLMKPLLSDDPAERTSALHELSPDQWIEVLNRYEFLRFHRLAAFLRQREPDDNIGYSILVYRVSDNDLSRALEGPPVELGRDILGERFGVSP